MMDNITSLFSRRGHANNWYLQKWILLLGFIALLGFNLSWLAQKSASLNLTTPLMANKPVIKPEKTLFTPKGLPTRPTPLATEVCNNGIDDDGDGNIDCYDGDCANDSACDGFFYGNPIPSCNFTANTGDFTLTEVWNTRTANGGVAGDNSQPGTSPFDQRATVMVGDMDGDGVPEVVAKQDTPGKLYLFNGATGAVEVSVDITDSDKFTSVAIGDVDKDGLGEIFFFDIDGKLQRYDYANGTLTQAFISTTTENARYTPNLADFNQDGVVEVYAGNKIYSAADGSRLVNGSGSDGGHNSGGGIEPFSIAVDVLADGACTNCAGLELVAGNTVYSINIATGAINAEIVAAGGLDDGVTSIADVDNDGDIDGVVVSDGTVYVWDLQTSAQLFTSSYNLTGTDQGGRANVANFDSDAELEIGVAGKNFYIVLDGSSGTLSKKWEITGLDDGSQRTSSTVFDFDGDGVSEVVYSEEENLVVYNGETGALKTSIISRSGTRYDNPVVVDVNNDGQSEIILTAQDANGPSDDQNAYVRCFKSLDRVWRPSRAVWNQHSYFITNVNDDLTIPRVQQNSITLTGFDGKPYKKILNTFLNQASIYDAAGDHIFPAADMQAELNGGAASICQSGGVINYSFIVKNVGSATLPAGVNIAIFDSSPYAGTPTKIAEIPTTEAVPVNGTLLVTGSSTSGVLTNIHVLLNHNHDAVVAPLSYPLATNTTTTGTAECSYANNYSTIPVTQLAPPSETLTVTSVGGNIVCPGGTATIRVANAENNVTYQLRKGTTDVGTPQTGDGTSDLDFSTGTLSANETFNIVATNAGGCSQVLTTTQTIIVIDQSLTVTVASTSICSGTSTTITLLKSQSGVTYQLRNGTTNIGSSVTGNGGTLTFNTGNLNSNTTFNILASGGACTGGSQLTTTPTVSASPNLTLTVSPNNTSICSGGTVSFTIASSETGVTYQLHDGTANTGSSGNGNGGNLVLTTGAMTASKTISVNVSRTGPTCNGTLTSTHAITVNTSPTISLTVGAVSATICSGSNTNVTVASSQTGVSYQLRNDADDSNIGSAVAGTGGTINLPTGNLSATTTFNVQATIAGCTAVELTNKATVTVNSSPTTSLTVGATNTTVCSGTGTDVTVASSQSGVSYQLRNDADDSSVGSAVAGTGGTINLPTGNLTSTTIFNILATVAGCTPVELTNKITVNVNNSPTIGLTVGAASSTICSGTGTNVTVASSETGVSYQLRNDADDSNVGTEVVGTGGTISLPTGNLTTNTTFNVLATRSGCTGQQLTNTVTITITTSPVSGLTVSADNTSLCSAGQVNVTVASSETGVSYQLRNNTDNSNVGSAVAGTGGTINLPTGTISTTSTFNILATRPGCSSVAQTNTVTVTVANFSATIENGSSVNFCGTSGVLTATSVAGGSYQWKKDGTNISGATNNDLTVTEAGSYTVTVTVNGCGQTSAASVVTITPIPATSVDVVSDAASNTICAGSSITFTATATNGGTNPTYQWRINGGDVTGANQTTYSTSSLNNDDAVTVVMTSSLTCAQAATSGDIMVTVNPMPTVTFAGVEANVEGNNKVTINEGESITVNLTGAASYTWTPTTNITTSNEGAQAVITPPTTTTYVVVATSTAGCTSSGSDTLQVVVNPLTSFFVPTLFTPNGDGNNDNFVVRGESFDKLTLRIYDRSGHVIYETNSVSEATTKGWDGTKGGVNQPIGMYTWTVTGNFTNGKPITMNGASAGKINLLR